MHTFPLSLIWFLLGDRDKKQQKCCRAHRGRVSQAVARSRSEGEEKRETVACVLAGRSGEQVGLSSLRTQRNAINSYYEEELEEPWNS